MPADIIGHCRCPVCASDKASLRVSTKQLAYVCCNTCNFQGFARSDHSDMRLRALLIAPLKLDAPGAPAPAPAPAPPTEKKRAAWGFMSGSG